MARMTPRLIDRPAAYTTIPSELSRKRTGTTLVGRTVEMLLAADTPMPCQAAKAIRNVPMRYRLSSGVPVTYVPAVTCSTKTLSAAAKRTSPAPSVHQSRPGRQPRTAKTATTMVTRTMSPIGYAMFVATLVPLIPALALMIGVITRMDSSAATPRAAIRPSIQMVFDVCGTVSRTRRPMPGNANTKNVRKAGVGYRGIRLRGDVLHPGGEQDRSGGEEPEADRESSPAPAPAPSRYCPPGAQRRAAHISGIGDPDIKEVIGRAGFAENCRPEVEHGESTGDQPESHHTPGPAASTGRGLRGELAQG